MPSKNRQSVPKEEGGGGGGKKQKTMSSFDLFCSKIK